MPPMPPVQPDQFEQFLYKSHHASQPMPEVLMPPEVSIDAPSDSDSSRRQSYQVRVTSMLEDSITIRLLECHFLFDSTAAVAFYFCRPLCLVDKTKQETVFLQPNWDIFKGGP